MAKMSVTPRRHGTFPDDDKKTIDIEEGQAAGARAHVGSELGMSLYVPAGFWRRIVLENLLGLRTQPAATCYNEQFS
jgi:hypothetical protein